MSTADVFQPTLLVLETLLATHAALLDQEGASWAILIVHVTVVLYLRMTASLGTSTLEATWWRLSTARQRWSQDGTATIATDLVKDCLATGSAGALVAEILADMVSTLERSAARTGADVLSFEAVIDGSNMSRIKGTSFALDGLSLSSLSFSLTAALIASVTAAIKRDTTDTHALRRFYLALMTNGSRSSSAAATVDGNGLETGHAFSRMAQLFARVTTRKWLHARLLAVRDGILARSACIGRDFRELCLSTRTVRDNIRRTGAMARVRILRMTRLLAVMKTAVKGAAARVGTCEYAGPIFDDSLAILGKVLSVTLDLISPIRTQQSLLDLATVATSVDTNLASAAEAFVAWPGASVFTAGHEVAADFTTAPAVFVVGVCASASGFVFAAKTRLCRAHMSTWRARTSMTSQLARMGTLAHSFSATRIATRVRRQARNSARFDLLFAPTGI